MDDETLLRRYAREGDEAAFRALAQRYGGLVYAACLRDLRRPELAEDAAQAVFLVLARKAGRLRVRTTLVSWLVATARLVSRSAQRTERRRPTVPLDERVPAPVATSDAALFEALDALGGPEREAVVLRFVQGLSLAEVGRAQGVSEDAARMRVNRALKRLRTEYVPALAAPLSLDARLATLALPKPLPFMTTPLLLATSGLAALAAIAAAQRTTPSAPPPARASAQVVPPNRSQASATTAATEPRSSGKAGTFPALERPFTVVYRCIERDLRSQAEHDQEAARYRRELQREVNADRLSLEGMEAQVAAVRIRHAPREGDVTLSYDGRTLYVRSNGLGGEAVFLVRGSSSYQFPQNAPRYDPSYSEGYELYTVTLPTIGASLPFLPFVKRGKTLVAEGAPGQDGKPQYNPGRVEIAGGRVVRIVNKFPERRLPYGITTLSAHRRVAGVEIAGRVTYLEQGQDARPSMSREFRLISASDEPLPANRFDPQRYLPERTNFGVSHGRISRSFLYERTKGPLDAQIRAFVADGRW